MKSKQRKNSDDIPEEEILGVYETVLCLPGTSLPSPVMVEEYLKEMLQKPKWTLIEASYIISSEYAYHTDQTVKLPRMLLGKILADIGTKQLSQATFSKEIQDKIKNFHPPHSISINELKNHSKLFLPPTLFFTMLNLEIANIYKIGDVEHALTLSMEIAPEYFLEWALDNKLITSKPLLQILEIGFPNGFHDKLSKPDKGHIQLLSRIQVIWYENPSSSHQEIAEHNLINGTYKTKDEEVRIKGFIKKAIQKIDHRSKQCKKGGRPPKKLKRQQKKRFKSPQPIEKVISYNATGIKIEHFEKFRLILQTIGHTIRFLYPSYTTTQIRRHPVTQSYLKDVHPVIKKMAYRWLTIEI